MTTDAVTISATLADIADSYRKARVKHKEMRGPHEGYAIMLEEFDELWEEVRKWQPDQSPEARAALRKEALHVAAMSLAFILEALDYHD